jgi:hypothetical protein
MYSLLINLIEPLNLLVQAQLFKYWALGRNIVVRGPMLRFTSWILDILTISSKPIPTRYKLWAVA